MNKIVIYALDFDGVLCDSAVETGITGWKAAVRLWDDMADPLPSEQQLIQFRQARPIIETGYEAILVMRMLFEGHTIDDILSDFATLKQQKIMHADGDTNALKKLFGETRDDWIKNDLDEWVAMNPLFPGIAEKLQKLSEQGVWYIITTKQERFAQKILTANQITIPDDRIFGLDRNLSKTATLIELSSRHPHAVFHFVEDRLPTLLNVLQTNELQSVKLFFATWGYNSELEKTDAEQQDIELINLETFLN